MEFNGFSNNNPVMESLEVRNVGSSTKRNYSYEYDKTGRIIKEEKITDNTYHITTAFTY